MSALALIVADFCDWLADEIETRRVNGRAPDVPVKPQPPGCPCVTLDDRGGRHHHSRDYRCGARCCV